LAKPKVKVPMLVDQSLNLATVLIKNSGLEVGNIEYKYDEIGNNLVVTQSINGMEVPAGKMVTKGTRIDLLVIKNQRNEEASDSTVKVDSEQQEKPPAEEKPKRKRRNKRR
jgi:beta-lactam-binding protein with PASTA domain